MLTGCGQGLTELNGAAAVGDVQERGRLEVKAESLHTRGDELAASNSKLVSCSHRGKRHCIPENKASRQLERSTAGTGNLLTEASYSAVTAASCCSVAAWAYTPTTAESRRGSEVLVKEGIVVVGVVRVVRVGASWDEKKEGGYVGSCKRQKVHNTAG